jgi:glycosyltransferase involved in cell wall biosynthesis
MSTGETRITVVMITHNRRDETLSTLEQMTTLPDAVPIVVVDNASDDGTVEAIAQRYPQVKLMAATENLGAVGRNHGVRQVQTPYVAFCDDDTRWQAGALSRAADLLDAHPALGSVTGRCLVEPDLREDPITSELRESPVPGPDWLPGPALLGIMAGLTMVRVSAFLEVGGFCGRMWFGGEEELLALDLASHGWWMCWAEDVVIHHAPSPVRDTQRRRQLGIRNTLWTLWLRRPVRSALRRTGLILWSAPKDLATLAAVIEALRGTPWIFRERQVVPPSVEYGLRMLDEPQRLSVARRYVG